MADEVDLIADLNAEDDDGLSWSTLADASDPERVVPGAMLLAGGLIPFFGALSVVRDHAWTSPLVLGLLFVALGLVSDSLYALAAGTVGDVLRRRRRALRYGSGVVFIGLGTLAALAKRN